MKIGDKIASLRDESAAIYVVIPVYNSKAYLHHCINSLCNNDFQDYHLICVDDGSTDGSGELLDELAAQNSKITVIHQENAGVSAARNIALKLLYNSPKCQNSFITFVDSDDYVHPQYLSVLIDLIQKNKLDCCECSYECTTPTSPRTFTNTHYSAAEISASFSVLKEYNASSFNRIWGYAFLIADLKDLFFKLSQKWGEDCLFINEYMSRRNRKIGVCTLPLYKYVRNQTSATYTVSFEDFWIFIEELDSLIEKAPSQNKPTILKKALREACHIRYGFRFDKVKHMASQEKLKNLYHKHKVLMSCLPLKERFATAAFVHSSRLYCCYRWYLKKIRRY